MSVLELVVVVVCVLSLASLALQVIGLLRRRESDGSEVERAMRDEVAKSREEAQVAARTTREELQQALASAGQANDLKHERLREVLERSLGQLRVESADAAAKVRDVVTQTLQSFDVSVGRRITDLGLAQKTQLELVTAGVTALADNSEKRAEALRASVEDRLQSMQNESSNKLETMRVHAEAASKQTREDVAASLKAFNDSVLNQMAALGDLQRKGLVDFATQLEKLTASNQTKLDELRALVDARLKTIQEESSAKLEQMRLAQGTATKETRDEVGASLKAFTESVVGQVTTLGELQRLGLTELTGRLETLTTSNQLKLDEVKGAVDTRLKGMQEDSAKQLEQMRATVDEKLQGTLEKRLGESFKQVSERLEQVYKGLGEMQVLATGVGDLKKVLGNVKTRGTWGEVQLGALLEQVLSPAQYASNVSPKDNGERVEFAVRMPARGGELDDIVWLPIDAKFPIEDYQRLVDAQESADATAIDAASGLLDIRIKQCAKDIADKYVSPPQTTDFGILFLPTEGLFAEVVRRPGLCEVIQQKYRVVIAGPTTLWSILTSLQMGFRTLAIQKRSSEVWQLLAAVKTEWSKYGDILDKVNKKLQETSNTMEQAAVRTRAIGRKLRAVEELPAASAELVLGLDHEIGTDVAEELDA